MVSRVFPRVRQSHQLYRESYSPLIDEEELDPWKPRYRCFRENQSHQEYYSQHDKLLHLRDLQKGERNPERSCVHEHASCRFSFHILFLKESIPAECILQVSSARSQFPGRI